ncbi:MAG: pyridoxal-phosphate dependent enzyme [Phycisphaerales bacterium]|nr:pyridoxal-phosphate dependent enzyme [Phycisphaerales bacterium]
MTPSAQERLDRRIELGTWPSPVIDAGALRDGLFIKNDGQCHPVYSGNKVRKLEYLLAESGPRIVTFGAAGSHHVLATAVHGQAHGHEVTAVLFARPWSPHAQEVLQAATGCADLRFFNDRAEAEREFERLGHDRTSIPAGGSTATGTLGYVRAAIELAAQVEAGLLPSPRRLFVPVGTAGTLAGLAVGVALAGLETTIVGIRVVPHEWLPPDDVTDLCRKTAQLVDADIGNWVLDDGWLGDGYGETTAAAEAAVTAAAGIGLNLETCYTGKALAAALAAGEMTDLYWQTHNQASLQPLVQEAPPLDPASWGW